MGLLYPSFLRGHTRPTPSRLSRAPQPLLPTPRQPLTRTTGRIVRAPISKGSPTIRSEILERDRNRCRIGEITLVLPKRSLRRAASAWAKARRVAHAEDSTVLGQALVSSRFRGNDVGEGFLCLLARRAQERTPFTRTRYHLFYELRCTGARSRQSGGPPVGRSFIASGRTGSRRRGQRS